MYNSPTQRERARCLRSNMTDAEIHLWTKLQHQQLGGNKFRRQVAIGPYIIDFACLRARLLIEVDGGQHNESGHQAKDASRDAWLSREGYRVLRFWNHEVLAETDAVLEVISRALDEASSPLPGPPPEGEGIL